MGRSRNLHSGSSFPGIQVQQIYNTPATLTNTYFPHGCVMASRILFYTNTHPRHPPPSAPTTAGWFTGRSRPWLGRGCRREALWLCWWLTSFFPADRSRLVAGFRRSRRIRRLPFRGQPPQNPRSSCLRTTSIGVSSSSQLSSPTCTSSLSLYFA